MKKIEAKPKKPPTPGIKEYYQKRNKILILRKTGGLGDILMHTMMFEGFHRTMPGIELSFACPLKYHQAVEGNPYLTELVDSEILQVENFSKYGMVYDTTRACCQYEEGLAPFSGKHRSDIWANHCGVILTKHEIYINLDEKHAQFGRDKLAKLNPENKPVLLLAPVSAMATKNLNKVQLKCIINWLKNKDLFVCGVHTHEIPELKELGIKTIVNLSIKEWIGVVNAADYVVSCDTSTFHLAGGLKKPLVGIFTFADGKVYGKYFDFVLVQKHRDNGDWNCGPCYAWCACPVLKKGSVKPCLTQITPEMIIDGIKKMLEKDITG